MFQAQKFHDIRSLERLHSWQAYVPYTKQVHMTTLVKICYIPQNIAEKYVFHLVVSSVIEFTAT